MFGSLYWWGGTICYFSVNIRDRFPGPIVLDAFCHNKTENYFENIKNKFLTPPTRGLKNCNPIISQKMKIITWGCLIAQMKRFDALITTQKTPEICKLPFWKKSRKIAQNDHFSKMTIFFALFLDFLRNGTSQAGVFCVVISASKRFIWSIKHPHTMIFIFRLIMGFWKFSDPR